MKRCFYIYILLFVCTACKINTTLQGLYSNQKKTGKDYPGLLRNADTLSLAELTFDSIAPKVYVINGNQLRHSLSNSPRAVVFFWSPKCKSRYCYPLEAVQRHCNETHSDLYVVAEYFDGKLMSKKYKIAHPVFGIDTKYYKTSLTERYTNRFFSDLKIPFVSDDRFYYFEHGIFVRSYREI